MRLSWKPEVCVSNRWYDSPLPIVAAVRVGNTIIAAGGRRIGWYEVGGRQLHEEISSGGIDFKYAAVLPGEMVILGVHEGQHEDRSRLAVVSVRDRREVWDERLPGKWQCICLSEQDPSCGFIGLTDGSILSFESDRGRIRVGNSWRAHAGPITALSVSPKGVLLSAAGNSVSFWTRDGKARRPGMTVRAGTIRALRLVSDDCFIWGGQMQYGQQGAIGVISVDLSASGERFAALPYDFGCSGTITALTMDEQRRYVFWAHQPPGGESVRSWDPRPRSAISVWEYTSAEQPATLRPCVAPVTSLTPTSVGGTLGLLCNTRNDPAEPDSSGAANRASFIPLHLP